MNKKSVKQLDVEGKRVLLRADLNVPLDEKGNITDDTRIRATLPTLQYLLQRGAAVIIISHLGRPKGKVVPELSLAPVAPRISELIKATVQFIPRCVGPDVEQAARQLEPGQLILLENLRFHPGEEENDPAFSTALAELADLYVNDAFGAVQRAHASLSSNITSLLPSAAGLLLLKEIEYLGKVTKDPPRPFYAILGGAKVSTKIPVIKNLLDKVDGLLIGGGMAYTFHAAIGRPIGDSLLDEESLEQCKQFLQEAESRGGTIYIPDDHVIAKDIKLLKSQETRVADMHREGIPDGWCGVDIGPKATERIIQQLANAMCVVWNGPMGVFETPLFAKGTNAVAHAIAGLTAQGVLTVLGGGDTAAAVAGYKHDAFSHISTGGGASLEFLAGNSLPGIDALPDAE